MPLETLEDLESFFEIDGGPAIRALILGPATEPPNQQFAKTIAVIFDSGSDSTDVYGDTNVETADASFKVTNTDLAGLKRGFTVRFLGVLPGEEGYGKSYEVGRWKAEGAGTSRVHLKEL